MKFTIKMDEEAKKFKKKLSSVSSGCKGFLRELPHFFNTKKHCHMKANLPAMQSSAPAPYGLHGVPTEQHWVGGLL